MNYAPCGKHRFSGRNFEEIQSALVTTAEDGIRAKNSEGTHLLYQNGWFMMEKSIKIDDLGGNVGKTIS